MQQIYHNFLCFKFSSCTTVFPSSIECFFLQQCRLHSFEAFCVATAFFRFGAATSCRGPRLSLSCVVVLSNCFALNEKKQTETKHGNNEVIFFRRLLCGNEC